MKTIIAAVLLSFSAASMATTLEEAIRKIESGRGASCQQTDRSTSVCTGIVNGNPATCFYTYKYTCDSRDGGFLAKIRMVESWNNRENAYVARVRKIIIIK